MSHDLSLSEKSITAKVESLIGKMSKMNLQTLKSEFLSVINSKDTHVSETTRKMWINSLNKVYTLSSMYKLITNLYLKGSNLGLTTRK